MFTSTEVARLVGIGSSTLRRYIKIFGEKFSPQATRKRNRTYTQHDYDLVLQIKNMYEAGLKEREIKTRLKAYKEEEAPEIDMNALVPRIAEEITTILSNQRRQDTRQAALEQYVRDLDAWDRLGFWEKRRTPKPRPPE